MKLMRNKREEVKRHAGGRPRVPKELKQKYQRIAAYPSTHARIKKHAEEAGKNMIDWLEEFIP